MYFPLFVEHLFEGLHYNDEEGGGEIVALFDTCCVVDCAFFFAYLELECAVCV